MEVIMKNKCKRLHLAITCSLARLLGMAKITLKKFFFKTKETFHKHHVKSLYVYIPHFILFHSLFLWLYAALSVFSMCFLKRFFILCE